MAASRRLETLLRNRYESQPVGASEQLAARAWDVRLRPLEEARAQRRLAPDVTPPAVWFAAWVDAATEAIMTALPLPAEGAEGNNVLNTVDPLPRIPLLGLWGLTFGTAAVGTLTSPAAVHVLATADWKLIGSIVAVIVGVATCVNFSLGWFRPSARRPG